MKLAIGLLSLALGFSAFAGPEEHLQNQTRYTIQVPQGEGVPANIPSEICLEEVVLTAATKTISIYSYFQPQLWQNLLVTNVKQTADGDFTFSAEKILSDISEGTCGYSETSTLLVSGKTDYLGRGNPAKLKIIINHSTMHDNCHSNPNDREYTYKVN